MIENTRRKKFDYSRFLRFILAFLLFLVSLIFYAVFGSNLTILVLLIQLFLLIIYVKKNRPIWLLPTFIFGFVYYLVLFVILPKSFSSTPCMSIDKLNMAPAVHCYCKGIEVKEVFSSRCYGTNVK